jgi:hypothetical protein
MKTLQKVIGMAISIIGIIAISLVVASFLEVSTLAVAGSILFISLIMPRPQNAAYLTFTFTEGLAGEIRESLVNYVKQAPHLMRTPVGFLESLISSYNTTGVEKIPVPKNGKKRQILLRYMQRATEDVMRDTEGASCDGETYTEPLEKSIDVTGYVETQWNELDDMEMRKLIENKSDWRDKTIMGSIDAFMRYLNKKLIAVQASKFGQFNPAQTPNELAVTLLKASDNGMNHQGELDILNAFEDIGFSGDPIVVGSGNLRDYSKLAKIGCCNAVTGVDNTQLGRMRYYNDRFVAGITGTDHFIGMAPGYVQFVNWPRYKGEWQSIVNGVYMKTTIVDPITGLELDMHVRYDDCKGKWVWKLSMDYELVHLPDNAFNAYDELNGVNFTLDFVGQKA